MATPALAHYTAIINIERIVPAHEKPPGASHDRIGTKVERSSREVSKLVIRAETLPALINKATAHLALVEDYN